MNKKLIRVLLFIGYCVPSVFLSMYVDVSYDTMLLYVGMILLFAGLCFGAIKSKQYPIVFFGNIISFLISYICTKIFYVKNWEWYFKPFIAEMLMVFITGIVFVIQMISAWYWYRKDCKKCKE